MAYVYLLGDSGQENSFKIGVTRGKLENRIKKLQTGNGEEIFLLAYYETDYPFYIEKMMHLKYHNENKRDEWFNLDAKAIVDFQKDCKEIEDRIETLKNNEFFMKKLK